MALLIFPLPQIQTGKSECGDDGLTHLPVALDPSHHNHPCKNYQKIKILKRECYITPNYLENGLTLVSLSFHENSALLQG